MAIAACMCSVQAGGGVVAGDGEVRVAGVVVKSLVHQPCELGAEVGLVVVGVEALKVETLKVGSAGVVLGKGFGGAVVVDVGR